MSYFFYIFLGILVGGAYDFWSALLGGVVGFFMALMNPFVLRSEFEELHQRLHNLSQQNPNLTQSAVLHSSVVNRDNVVGPAAAAPPVNNTEAVYASSVSRPANTLPSRQSSRPQEPAKPSELRQFLVSFFTEGNVVAKVGMILVFIGVAFLLKLASDYGKFPIEMRLFSLGVGAIALMAVGFRLRKSKPMYALILQGGGVGIFYANIFAAYRLYDLLPAGVTFLVLIVAVMFATFLAILQNAKSLAVMASLGGFLAPILASSNSGNHVALFSYYAILNVGIFCVAWFQSWRILNLIGFAFTFGVGAVWGLEYYRPELFASVEPFLILNFLCYFVISILYAIKKASERQMLVDGTLVFGTPILFFSMQYPLVADYQYGVFWSALALGALYLCATQFLWNKYSENLRFFTETFLSLGVVFATLSVAFLFENPTLAVLYAIEGAGLVFVGVRQKRRLAYWSGSFLIAFVSVGYCLSDFNLFGSSDSGLVSNEFLPLLAITMASVFAARTLFHAQKTLPELDRILAYLHSGYGVLFWLILGFRESDYQLSGEDEIAGFVLFLSVTSALFEYLRRQWPWPEAKIMLVTYPIVLSFIWLTGEVKDIHWTTAVWILALGVLYTHLKRSVSEGLHRSSQLQHFLAAWLVVLVLASVSTEAVTTLWEASGFWQQFFYLFWPIATVGWLSLNPPAWPVRHQPKLYAKWILGSFVALSWFWIFALQQQHTGSAAPLPYLPFLNPLDLSVAIFCMALVSYERFCRALPEPVYSIRTVRMLSRFYFFTIFIWLSMVVVRSVHHYDNIAFDFDTLFASRVLQTALTIFWSFFALIVMVLASRQRRRYAWLAGASLLALVVVKLFFVDLSQVGNIARVVSFLGSGAVFVLIGYLSPIPPVEVKCEVIA